MSYAGKKKKAHCNRLVFSDDISTMFGSYDAARAEALENLSADANDGEELTFSEDQIWREIYLMIEDESDDFWCHVRCASQSLPGKFLVVADLGLWDGRHAGGKIFDSLEQALKTCADRMDNFDVYEDRYGNLLAAGHHHDGSNYFRIYKLTAKGEEYARIHQYDLTDRELHGKLMRNEYRRAIRLRKVFGWC